MPPASQARSPRGNCGTKQVSEQGTSALPSLLFCLGLPVLGAVLGPPRSLRRTELGGPATLQAHRQGQRVPGQSRSGRGAPGPPAVLRRPEEGNLTRGPRCQFRKQQEGLAFLPGIRKAPTRHCALGEGGETDPTTGGGSADTATSSESAQGSDSDLVSCEF